MRTISLLTNLCKTCISLSLLVMMKMSSFWHQFFKVSMMQSPFYWGIYSCILQSGFEIRWIFTHIGVPFTETMLTKVRHLKTWISFFYVLTRSSMEGVYIFISHQLSLPWKLIFIFFNNCFFWRMILETNGPLIAEKVTSHSMDADAPLSEQVNVTPFQLSFYQ